MIRNKQYVLNRAEVGPLEALPAVIEKMLGDKVLRWYIGHLSDDDIVVEATICDEGASSFTQAVTAEYYPGKNVVLSIIPTGVGCKLGGYAGDAAPATSLLAAAADYLITNPNAVNASDFIKLADNVIYTEGFSLDLFCQGLTNLYWPHANRIGLIIEKAPAHELDAVFNVLNAVRAIHGVELNDVVVTESRIGGRCVENGSGAFVGTIDQPGVLLEACEQLLARGVDAIGVTSNIQDLPPESYAKHFAGEYPNPVGGVEAVISHLITRHFQVPSVHAPLINIKQLDLLDKIVDARGAGEMASVSGLACILIGLHRAPQLKPRPTSRIADIFNLNNLLAVVAPASCLGGIPVLATRKQRIPVIAVQENDTVLNITQARARLNDVIEVRSYAEAAGVVLALRKGISLGSIARPLQTLRRPASVERLSKRAANYEEQLVA